MKKIDIKYFDEEMTKIEKIKLGDCIDLRSAVDIDLKKGEFKLIPLGIAMKLPKGYEAHVYPRSSTFKNYKILQVNSVGIIDCSYCGDNDQWMYPSYATEDTHISKNDRICQFRIVKNQPKISFNVVEKLLGKDRKGFGSSGIK